MLPSIESIEEIFTEIVEEIENDDPKNYHHHTKLHHDQFIKAQDNGLLVRALCGYSKKPEQDNPLKKPCCPKCRALMNTQCLGEFYRPE